MGKCTVSTCATKFVPMRGEYLLLVTIKKKLVPIEFSWTQQNNLFIFLLRIQRVLKEMSKADASKAAALKMLRGRGGDDDDDDDESALKKLVMGSGGPADPLTLGIATLVDGEDVTVSYETGLISNDRKSLGKVWEKFEKGTKLSNEEYKMAEKGQELAACLMVRIKVPAMSTRKVTFALAWDMPVVRFNSGRGYYRRYTKWYGRDGSAINKLLIDALEKDAEWEKKLDDWQCTILRDKNLPNWYKQALFNELYYLAEGGSVWTDGELGKDKDDSSGEGKGEESKEKEQSHQLAQSKNRMTMIADGEDRNSPVLGPWGGDINPGLTLNFSKQHQDNLQKGKKELEIDLEHHVDVSVEDEDIDDEVKRDVVTS